jgi:hypothetical protein
MSGGLGIFLPDNFTVDWVNEDIKLLGEFMVDIKKPLSFSEDKLRNWLKLNRPFWVGELKEQRIPYADSKGKWVFAPPIVGTPAACAFLHWFAMNVTSDAPIMQWVQPLNQSIELGSAFAVQEKIPDIFKWYGLYVDLIAAYYDNTIKITKQQGPATLGPANFEFINLDAALLPMANHMEAVLADVGKRLTKAGFANVTKGQKRNLIAVFPRETQARQGILGYYTPDTGGIVINMYSLMSPLSKKKQMVQTIVHELAHLIYLEVLPQKARDLWFESWRLVEQEKQKRIEQLPTASKVTLKDRLRYFKALEKANFDPSKALRKLKPADNIKFRAWMFNPSPDFAQRDIWWSYSPDSIELTTYAEKRAIPFFRNKELWVRKHGEGESLGHWEEKFLRALGLSGPNMRKPWPDVSWEGAQTRYVSMEIAVEKALDALKPPTDYSKTDALEDFAETFAYYLTQPSALSFLAWKRLLATLKVGGVYKGKMPSWMIPTNI